MTLLGRVSLTLLGWGRWVWVVGFGGWSMVVRDVVAALLSLVIGGIRRAGVIVPERWLRRDGRYLLVTRWIVLRRGKLVITVEMVNQ